MTAFATVLAIVRAGAVPVLADIDPHSGLLDPDSVARCLSPRSRALLLVHLYGQMAGMPRWRAFCAQHQLKLIEDCAQAHLASEDGRLAGTWGAAGAFSFYPTKNLGAVGDAGALLCAAPDLAETARCLRNYGQSERYHHPHLGLNSRLDELQATILLTRLPQLATDNARRQEIAGRYRRQLRHPHVKLLAPPPATENHVYHLLVVLSPLRQRLQTHLAGAGIQTLIHYPVPLHRQPALQGIRTAPGGLPHSEQHAAHCLSLPCHPYLTDAEVDRVCAAINDFS